MSGVVEDSQLHIPRIRLQEEHDGGQSVVAHRLVPAHPVYGALPDDQLPDALFSKFITYHLVPLTVALELLLPEADIALRHARVPAPRMLMPEAPHDEYGRVVLPHPDVGMSGDAT